MKSAELHFNWVILKFEASVTALCVFTLSREMNLLKWQCFENNLREHESAKMTQNECNAGFC